MITKESMCNGCPDCTNCHLGREYAYVLTCNYCYADIGDKEYAVEFFKNGKRKHICSACIPEFFGVTLDLDTAEDDDLYEEAIKKIADDNGVTISRAADIIEDYKNEED